MTDSKAELPEGEMEPQVQSCSVLSGIRVVELGRLFAAPFAGQMLADLGADVIKVERPGLGDEMRRYGPPFIKDRNGQQTDFSPPFVAVNRNKRSVTIDFAKPQGKALLLSLIEKADVFIENLKTGVLERYGLGRETIRAINPRLVHLSVTGFGQNGPDADRPGTDLIFQAASGLMSVTGQPDGPPERVGIFAADLMAGLYSSIGLLAALRARDASGCGQHIDMALLDATIAALTSRATEYLISGEVPRRNGSQTPGAYPAQLFACRDGSVAIQASSVSDFAGFCSVLGFPEFASDLRFAARHERMQNLHILAPRVNEALANWNVEDLCTAMRAAGILVAPINDMAQVFEEPQVKARNILGSIEHPQIGTIPIIANPIRLSETPITTFRAPPHIGEHNEAALSEWLNLTPGDISTLRAEKAI
jgi:crotonobetainyl-CoA:carnitine CoA-transferase CaiB-like acyl-CoA transferase